MQDVTIALVQMNAPLGKTTRNLEAHRQWAEKAAGLGAELVCFPELSLTGHWCAGGVWEASEEVPTGPSTEALMDLARNLGVFLCFGVAERERGLAYNTYVVVGPEGFVGKQRKLQLSGDEYFHFRGGTQIAVLDLGLCRLGVGICYDSLFPEVSRIAAIRGAEVYLMPHAARIGAWPRDRQAHPRLVAECKRTWRKVYAARAYDNGMYVAICNQAGKAGTKPRANHAGGILLFDPNGELVAESQTEHIEDELVVCRLSAEAFAARRRSACFNLQTRRPELYSELAQSGD